jgi:hypothetical protein
VENATCSLVQTLKPNPNPVLTSHVAALVLVLLLVFLLLNPNLLKLDLLNLILLSVTPRLASLLFRVASFIS